MTEVYRPTARMRCVMKAASGYRHVFADSAVASRLSQPRPTRHTGFHLTLLIEQVKVETEDVVSLTLSRPDGALLPRWIPGAHLDVVLPSGRQRQYSLCGDPEDRSRYRIAVRLIRDGGGGSAEVHGDLRVGDTLGVRGPRNAFPLIQAESYLLMAGGIGVTPILPMARALAAGATPWRMVYLGRSRARMPFLDELATLGNVDIRPDDESGTADVAGLLASTPPGCAVYLCGPPSLLTAARDVMPMANPTGSLHTERFSALPVVAGRPFEVQLRRAGTTVSVGAQQTALAAIRQRLPDVAYSCQQGFCGSCKVRVLEGAVDHRDSLLAEQERADSMLVCVSRAAGSTLVLDL